MELIMFYLLIVAIVVLSGLISGSEAALLSVSYTKAKEIQTQADKKSQRRADVLIHIKENIDQYITTIVVMNNVVNIIGSIYVGVLAQRIFNDDLFLGIISGTLTFLIIMFAEIIPKVYGEKHCDGISLRIATPLLYISKLLKPVNFILNKISNFFVKRDTTIQVSEGEIKEMAALGHQAGSINKYESEVIRNVFDMNDTEVYEAMTPKNKVSIVHMDEELNSIISLAESTGHTRFPIANNRGEIIGLINIKDLFKFHNRKKKFSISKILRPIVYAPEAMKVLTLEQILKKERIHMAAIVNEHGDFTGILTLEDIIEEIIGDIADEFDKQEENRIMQMEENKYIILSNTEIGEINEELGLELPEDEDYSTMNGYLIAQLDKIPKVNDRVQIEEGKFRVISSTKKRVLKVEFTRTQELIS
jgi:CBS domain containing-hemolysin-like protein